MEIKIDNSPRGRLISLLGSMNLDLAKHWVDELIEDARKDERERVIEEAFRIIEEELSNRSKQPNGVPMAFADGMTTAQTIILHLKGLSGNNE